MESKLLKVLHVLRLNLRIRHIFHPGNRTDISLRNQDGYFTQEQDGYFTRETGRIFHPGNRTDISPREQDGYFTQETGRIFHPGNSTDISTRKQDGFKGIVQGKSRYLREFFF